MARILREWLLSWVLVGIIFITILILIPFFGPQAGSNPIAVIILFTVIIISFCLLTMNRYISSYFKSIIQDKKQVLLICPRCKTLVKKDPGICSQCGNKL